MKAEQHIKYSAIVSLLIAPFFGVKTLIFFAASILIDVDHWLDFIYRFKNFSIKKMFEYNNYILENRYNLRKKGFVGLSIFHTIEFFILILALSRFGSLNYLIYVFWGIAFHMLLDIIFIFQNKIPFIRAYSIIEYIVRIKKNKDGNSTY